ncbi:MAG: PAS domain S-box protein [Planctomycetaceae bacterium]|nr:PAS domain S-box protein [Planctomycetaceae bacterium]
MEQALRESELRTRSILQSALDGVVMMDEEGLVTFWNAQAEVIFGYAASEAVGQPLKDLIVPPSYRSAHVEGLRRFVTTGTSTILNQRLELSGLRRNGEEFPIELTVVPVRIGDRYEFSAFVRDVTERRRADQALRESQARLSRILEAAGAGIWEWNIATGELWLSDDWLQSLGYSRNDVVPHVDFAVSLIHPEDLPRVNAALDEHFQKRAPGYRCELRLRGKDGEYRWTQGTGKVVEWDENGKPLRLVGSDTDITEQKRAETHLQELNRTLERRVEERTLLMELLKDVAATCNQAESVEEACSAVLERVCRYLGWSLAHAFVVAHDPQGRFARSDLWFPHTPRSTTSDVVLDEALNGSAISGQSEWISDVSQISDVVRREEFEQLGIRAVFNMPVMVGDVVVAVLEFFHSEPAPPNAELQAVADQLGRLLGRVVERAQLQQAVEESVGAEQRRIGQELHDGIGQELTALSFLSRSIALTLKSEGSSAADKADEFASSIPRLVRQIRNVIRGLMPVELDDDGLMSALQQLADSTQQRHGVRCQLEARRAVPVPNPTVAHHLFRIAQEAINNSLKHGRPQSILMTLKASDSTLDLTVRDDGTGIVVDTARSADGRSPGMGLRIMRHRARLIGGQLTIQCPSGGGTVVNCTLKGQENSHVGE